MSGETDLKTILQNLSPVMLDDTYVFCTVVGARYGDYAETAPIASYQENEGLTLVLTQERADASGLSYEGLFRCISLQVHSSLESVGLTAVVAGKLAAYEISANIIAGYYHDHVFVPQAQASEAFGLLRDLNKV
ncbi:ACT domain-containing protein [bacterium]|nr:ACT domain-containing protein [Porticoccaceae bacterium]MDB4001016.1 ACT domain-containing protein [bacterium]MDC0003563.1 ACT domain-containing protein [Porticoccaceae bacterium]